MRAKHLVTGLPVILLAGILLVLPCFVYGQYTYAGSTAPDLQVTQMTYWESNCTMYYWIANKGGAAAKSNLWVEYYPKGREVLNIPAMAANTGAWVQRSMWKKTYSGQTYCGMGGVTKVRVAANARYLYRYVNSQLTIGGLLPPGSYVPAGWYVGAQYKETNLGNNELLLYKSNIPTTSIKITTSVSFSF